MSNVLTHHNDNSRTGANLQEVQLTTSNVKVNQFGKRFTRQVDGQIYAQPLCVSNITMADGHPHNVVYVATMHNKVYAFDADDPNASTPLWQTPQLEPPVSLQDPNIGSGLYTSPTSPGYTDITVEIGILSTPVISLQNNALYVVAFAEVTFMGYSYWLHTLDLATGADKFGGPVRITGSVPGNCAGSESGTVSFTSYLDSNGQLVVLGSNRHSQRPALLLANNIIYIAFASYEDTDPYNGWVFAYNATTLQQVAVYNTTAYTTPSGQQGRGGIWQGGAGLAADSANNVYFLTGNGSFTGYPKGPSQPALGDSIVKLNPNLTLADWFSPFNSPCLAYYDTDLGSGGPLLIPNTNLLLGGGKEGKFYLVNTQNMGKFNGVMPTTVPPVCAGNDSQIVQSFYVVQGSNIVGGPVYWNGPYGPWVYIWSTNNDYLKAFALVGGTSFQTTPVSQGAVTALGGCLSISANGGIPGTGILWASTPNPANRTMGILRAHDASDLTRELWNSECYSARDRLGSYATWCPPTIANGKVYMATFSGELVVYGLLPPVIGSVNGAGFVSQRVPTLIYAGLGATVQVTMVNTGNTFWTPGGNNPYQLGSQNPQDNGTWCLNRVDLPTACVPPGGQVTFSFNIDACVTPGRFYNFQWQMVQEGVAWFGAYTPNVRIDVLPSKN